MAAGARTAASAAPARRCGGPLRRCRRLCASIERVSDDVLRLRQGERHAVVLACMIALYTTERSARAPELKAMTDQIVGAGGALTRLLVSAMALWRLRTFRYGATQ